MTENRLNEQLETLRASRREQGSTAVRTAALAMENPDVMVDVIVPAYNVEKYIRPCMESILSQKTDFTFHVIAVDDGGADSTGKILDEYKSDPRVTVIHQENKGLSGARNTALLNSTGKYVLFLDSDDLLARDALSHLVTLAEKENAQITAGSYSNFHQFRWLGKKHAQKSGILIPEKDMTGHAWGKLYRRTLFEKAQFPEGYWFEDSLMHHIVFPQAEKCAGTGQTVCLRRSNPASITHTAAGNPKSIDTVWVTLQLMKDRTDLQIPFTRKYYDYLLGQIRLNHIRLRGLGSEIQQAAFLVVADSICSAFTEEHTELEENRKTEAAVREMNYRLFAESLPEN